MVPTLFAFVQGYPRSGSRYFSEPNYSECNGEPCCSAEVIIGRPVRHHTSKVRNRTSCDHIDFIIMLNLAGLGRLQDVRALMGVEAR